MFYPAYVIFELQIKKCEPLQLLKHKIPSKLA